MVAVLEVTPAAPEDAPQAARPSVSVLGGAMRTVLHAFGGAVWLLTCAAAAQDLRTTDSAIAILHAAKREVDWDAKTAVSADVTCDGNADIAIVGYEKEQAVWVGVVPGSDKKRVSKPVMMRFPVGKHSQDSFCSVPVQIEAQPIECDDEELGALPGCKRVRGCSDFSIVDHACDSFHFYWDSSRKRLMWWRR